MVHLQHQLLYNNPATLKFISIILSKFLEKFRTMKKCPLQKLFFLAVLSLAIFCSCAKDELRSRDNFGQNWKFLPGDEPGAYEITYDDKGWRELELPHDWSIEGEFSADHPATPGGGALPGGIGWYRKTFSLDTKDQDKLIFIDFDGVYRNSKVWINGQLLGERPNGYISFRYDLTPYLKFGNSTNVVAVRVDNSLQPNSRWYSGSGIYRNVWIVRTSKICVDHWGTFITTPAVTEEKAEVTISVTLANKTGSSGDVTLITDFYDPRNRKVGSVRTDTLLDGNTSLLINEKLSIKKPELWSVENPVLYSARTRVQINRKVTDEYITDFGIRHFRFDAEKGFLLNGKQVKIKGVCNHHDLGCLGAAINTRALERQLELLKGMGCNAIRTSHNPPAPELLDLCDRMGFIIMDEAFDMWKKNKTPYDYSLYWDEWHERDLKDFMIRDRNHPSIFIWSIGNEILEQWDTSGIRMVQEIYQLARSVDTTRPIVTANNPPSPTNNLNIPMVTDLIGYNYAHREYEKFPQVFPGQKFIGTETTSALATRGHYDMPSDSIRRWPVWWDKPFNEGNPDNTVSAYDHVSAPWGSTHEETWKVIKKHDYLSGMYIWTGFDYLGEPTPYGWPSRSSYFGIIDLAGFPKDAYFMYKSEWTSEPVLHIFPHWNWNEGDSIDIWAYFNCDEVELFLNGESQGVKKKEGDNLHVMWRLAYKPGIIRAEGRTRGETVLTREIKTAGEPAGIALSSDRSDISANGKDLSFITVEVLDKDGTLVPNAGNLISFSLKGDAFIAGVDNGSQTSHEPFKASYRKAFNGKCLLVVQAGKSAGDVIVSARSEGLREAELRLKLK
jgi:beta-galactosidase